MSRETIFSQQFLERLKDLVMLHHSVYPFLPPQGIFFEALVEQAFLRTGIPREKILVTNPNQPQHDLTVDDIRISLKTETGKVTKLNRISIKKLCTTETGEWTSEALLQHALNHLNRYDHMLMLRTIWGLRKFLYQVVEIPLDLLKKIASVTVAESGRRAGRRSLSALIYEGDDQLFQIRFDGADGKCQIKGLRIDRCLLLLEWDYSIPPAIHIFSTSETPASNSGDDEHDGPSSTGDQ